MEEAGLTIPEEYIVGDYSIQSSYDDKRDDEVGSADGSNYLQ